MSRTTPDLTALPSATSLTLLLKNGKSTTLLSLAPDAPIASIRTHLLLALQSRRLPGLPASPAGLALGVLRDKRDAGKGWMPLAERARDLAAKKGAAGAGGKKKRAAKTDRDDDDDDDDTTLEAAGLVDGSWVAWRVRGPGETTDRDADGDAVVVDLDLESDDAGAEDPGWDVVIPQYEDAEEEEEKEKEGGVW